MFSLLSDAPWKHKHYNFSRVLYVCAIAWTNSCWWSRGSAECIVSGAMSFFCCCCCQKLVLSFCLSSDKHIQDGMDWHKSYALMALAGYHCRCFCFFFRLSYFGAYLQTEHITAWRAHMAHVRYCGVLCISECKHSDKKQHTQMSYVRETKKKTAEYQTQKAVMTIFLCSTPIFF